MALDSGMEKDNETRLEGAVEKLRNQIRQLENDNQQLEDRLKTARALIYELVDAALK